MAGLRPSPFFPFPFIRTLPPICHFRILLLSSSLPTLVQDPDL